MTKVNPLWGVLFLFVAVPAWGTTLTWTDNSNNEDQFIVYIGHPTPNVEVGRVGANVTTFIHTGVTEGCYHVTAINAGGESIPSNMDCTKPNAPTDLKVLGQ